MIRCFNCCYFIICQKASEEIKECELYSQMKRMEVDNYGECTNDTMQTD